MFDTSLIRTPVWDTDKVIRESAMMYKAPDGSVTAPLLYVPVEILEVTDLSGEIHYEEATDWVLHGQMLHLISGSRIPTIDDTELFPAHPEPGTSFPMPGGNSFHARADQIVTRQIQVTYTCQKGQWDGIRPASAKALLPRTFDALEKKKPFTMVLFGDSISANAQVSGSLGIPPYQPGYGDMLVRSLQDHYGCPIRFVNTSVGGKETRWAIDQIEESVNAHDPDLLIIAFGMNDGGKTPAAFEQNIRTMIRLVRDKHPLCEIILVATSLPNPILTDPKAPFWGNQQFFLKALESIAADSTGIAAANITDMHRYLLSKKRFLDLTSNNVNHPNDFFYRCYAQFLMEMLK